MKKLPLSLLLIIIYVLPSFAQKTSDWFVSISSGAGWGGPSSSIKKGLEKSGFNQGGSFDISAPNLTKNYPYAVPGLPVQVTFGRKIKENRSLYFTAGISNSAKVKGQKKEVYASWGSLIDFSHKVLATIKYNVYQMGAGYQYTYKNTNAKLGIGPSLYVFQYKHLQGQDKGNHASVTPGLSLSGRLPLGKERRQISVDLIAAAALALPANMKKIEQHFETANQNTKKFFVLDETNVNMVHGMLGLALSIRK